MNDFTMSDLELRLTVLDFSIRSSALAPAEAIVSRAQVFEHYLRGAIPGQRGRWVWVPESKQDIGTASGDRS